MHPSFIPSFLPSFLPALLPSLIPFLPSILRWRSRAKVLQSVSVWTLVLMFRYAFLLDLPYATPLKVTQIDETNATIRLDYVDEER